MTRIRSERNPSLRMLLRGLCVLIVLALLGVASSASASAVVTAGGPYLGAVDTEIAFDGTGSYGPNMYELVLVSGSYTWEQANDEAVTKQYPGCGSAHLATITSQEEQDAIEGLFDMRFAWLGGYQEGLEPAAEWHWVTGEAWDYTNWQPGEPSDDGGYTYENVLMVGGAGVPYLYTWNDFADIRVLSRYIVEYENCSGVFDWDFGDGNQALDAGPTPTHSYSEQGIYDVCLTVTNGGGSNVDCTIAVAYDPTDGFVTGGGWIDSPVGAIPPWSDLTSWWRADGDATDAVGANDGVLKNGATFTTGMLGQGFDLDGIDDYVEVADAPSLNPSTAMTLSAWVLAEEGSWNQHRDIVSKDGESSDRQYVLTVDITNRFRAHVWTTGAGLVTVAGGPTLLPDTWYHVAQTYDGSTLTLYVNGVPAGSVSSPGPIVTTTQPLRIGGGCNPGSYPLHFPGVIDGVRLYSRALTAGEIEAITQYDDPLTGKATFGFVSKYKKGADVPTGNTEFQFKAGDLNFHSSDYQWLVVNQADTNAQFKGSGTINGSGDYGFMLWATDGSPDTFRIKIWDAATENLIYDNQGQAIGGGSIVVHK